MVTPPESEVPVFGAPVVTGKFLWSANPESGKVALIDAESLSTRVLSAGLQPEQLKAIPKGEFDAAAIVINTGTSDASYFTVDGDNIQSKRVSLHTGANRWKIAPSGNWAVAWSEQGDDFVDPTDGLQEITLIDLSRDEPVARRVTVGYRPSSLYFDETEETLVVVSQLGISLIGLASEALRWVLIPQGEGREVSITSDGKHALIRYDASSIIQIVTLDDDGFVLEIPMPSQVSDLDLVGGNRVVAVARDASTMVTFLVDEILEDPEALDSVLIGGAPIGSAEVTSDGRIAVLYTNAFDSALATVVDLEEGDDFLSYRSLDTQIPISYVRISPDGLHAISIGKASEGVSAGAFSLFSLKEERFARVFGTSSPIVHVQIGNEAAVVTASITGGVHEAHLVNVAALYAETIPLASAPLSAGLVTELGVGFAAQNHPEGRVTFFDLGEADARTLTGFELSSEIVEE